MMNNKRYGIALIAVFVFVFIFDYVFHDVVMRGTYQELAHLWRPKSELAFMIASQFFYSVVIAFIFTRHYEGKGIMEGVRFGAYMGLLVGSVRLGIYSYLPITLAIISGWVIAEILKGIGSGIVLSLTYKK